MTDGALGPVTAWSDRQLRPTRESLRTAGLGVVTGALGGTATFVWTRATLLPPSYPWWLPIALMVAAGAYTYLFSRTLRTSVGAFAVSLLTALAVTILGWIAPLWLMSYPPAARDLLIQQYLQRAVIDFVFTYFTAFMSGYLGTITLDGAVDW